MRRILPLLVILLLVSLQAEGRKCDVRVLYWNIQNGMWTDQQNSYDNFVAYVRSAHPDICVWCEAKSLYKSNSTQKLSSYERYLPSNWDVLAERYGHGYVYVGADVDGYPQVITSRFPMANKARIAGQGPDSLVVHGAGWAVVNIRGKELNIVTLHPYPHQFARGISRKDAEAVRRSKAEFGGERYRRIEIEVVCRSTILTSGNASNELWMMLGDFNSISRRDNFHYRMDADSPAFLTHDYIAQSTPYIDAVAEKHPGEFFGTAMSGRRIDFIYVSPMLYSLLKSVDVVEAWEPRTKTGMSNFCRPSDHLPIVATFSF